MDDNVIQLAKIYNTLTLISTKGQDTIYMAECLNELKRVYEILSHKVIVDPLAGQNDAVEDGEY